MTLQYLTIHRQSNPQLIIKGRVWASYSRFLSYLWPLWRYKAVCFLSWVFPSWNLNPSISLAKIEKQENGKLVTSNISVVMVSLKKNMNLIEMTICTLKTGMGRLICYANQKKELVFLEHAFSLEFLLVQLLFHLAISVISLEENGHSLQHL